MYKNSVNCDTVIAEKPLFYAKRYECYPPLFR